MDWAEGDDAWLGTVLWTYAVAGALSVAIGGLGLYLVRRLWSSAPRRDFAVALAILATLVGAPALWATTVAVAEFLVPESGLETGPPESQ